MDTQEYTSWEIWKEAFRFYHRNIHKLAFIFPLLFVPIFVDAFLTVMIGQERSLGQIDIHTAIIQAARKTKDLLLLKLRYEISGCLWSFIPIIGWYKISRRRTYWAMASNVIAYENLPLYLAIKRCPELVDYIPMDKCFRVLITIPALIEGVLLISIGIGTFVFNNALVFVICTIAFFWTLLPWSAAVNTILYFSLPLDRVNERLAQLRIIRSQENYCPRCSQLGDTGICAKLQINILEYSSQFPKKCNASYFKSVSAT